MPVLSAEVLRSYTMELLEALGTSEAHAAMVCENLVGANLVGHDSHGVLRLPTYAAWVDSGLIKPNESPVIERQFAATAHVDGRCSWGAVGGRFCTDKAIELARTFGVGAVTLDHCAHIGRLGEYVGMMADVGFAGIALTNHMASVAPHGGRQRMLGTNPWAMSVPGLAGADPIIVDFATSGVAEGKLRVARARGEHVAPGLIINKDGVPSQDPEDFYGGGALLPFGTHKGYGLGLMADILGGILSGAGSGSSTAFNGSNGTLMIALDIERFVPLADFRAQVSDLVGRVHGSAPAAGFAGVLLPGEPESSTRERRLREGIYVPESTWDELQRLLSERKASSGSSRIAA